MRNLFSFPALTLLVAACGDEPVEAVEPPVDEPCTEQADAPATYDEDVAPILEAECLSCHGYPPTNFATISLGAYIDLMAEAFPGTPYYERVIVRAVDTEGMPPGGPALSEWEKATIQSWVDGGVLENVWGIEPPLCD